MSEDGWVPTTAWPLLGGDAPLGYPKGFCNLVLGETVGFSRPEREIENCLAYRQTDRYIYRTFGKKPLSATFDRLGNNATVAISYAQKWHRGLGFAVPPRIPRRHDRVVIEVYPALVKPSKIGKAFSPISELLPPEARQGTDAYDGAICALMALAYEARGRFSKLPRLVEPPDNPLFAEEGWIYHFPISRRKCPGIRL